MESILEKQRARRCLHISTMDMVIPRNWETTAIERTIRARKGCCISCFSINNPKWIVSKLVLKHGVEAMESILEKQRARLCLRISTMDMVVSRNLETTALERTIYCRNGSRSTRVLYNQFYTRRDHHENGRHYCQKT